MFSASADVYDLIYSGFKDYAAEVAAIRELIERLRPGSRTILDVACGSGEHARLLAQAGYRVAGLDLSPDFVRIAAAKTPGAAFHVADMVDFDLGTRFDVVLCLFSSIAYARTAPDITRALRCFARHLAPDGVALVEPWFEPGFLTHGRVAVNTAERDGVHVCRMARTTIEGRLSRLDFHYLIGRPEGVTYASELHELGLFTTAEMLDCFASAGLVAEHQPGGLTGRGLFIARRSAT